MKTLIFFFWFLWINLSNHAKKTAPNQADNIAIYQSCLLPKMRLSIVLEGRYTGYKWLDMVQKRKLVSCSWHPIFVCRVRDSQNQGIFLIIEPLEKPQKLGIWRKKYLTFPIYFGSGKWESKSKYNSSVPIFLMAIQCLRDKIAEGSQWVVLKKVKL